MKSRELNPQTADDLGNEVTVDTFQFAASLFLCAFDVYMDSCADRIDGWKPHRGNDTGFTIEVEKHTNEPTYVHATIRPQKWPDESYIICKFQHIGGRWEPRSGHVKANHVTVLANGKPLDITFSEDSTNLTFGLTFIPNDRSKNAP